MGIKFKNIIVIFVSILLFACQTEKQIIANHIIPKGYEGPLIILSIRDGSKRTNRVEKVAYNTYDIIYDSLGVAFDDYAVTNIPPSKPIKVINNYMYDKTKKELIPYHSLLYTYGQCFQDSTSYTINLIWLNELDTSKEAKIDSIIKQNLKKSFECESTNKKFNFKVK